jgi:hypothetical integral membrane protein (TIGR02206 family)
MHDASRFQLFGPAHLVVIGLTIGLPIIARFTLRGPERARLRQSVRYGLAGLMFADWIAYEVVRALDGQFTLRDAAPMQLCDWALFATIAALVTCRRGIYELAYFWGMSGTFQAILTPNLPEGFPSPRFFAFFIAHCGIVVGVMLLTATEGLRPARGALVRAMLWSQAYLVTALLVNIWTGANYGFLLHHPAGRSLLDYLPPNHLAYLGCMELLALLFFCVLYAPFLLMPARQRAKAAPI